MSDTPQRAWLQGPAMCTVHVLHTAGALCPQWDSNNRGGRMGRGTFFREQASARELGAKQSKNLNLVTQQVFHVVVFTETAVISLRADGRPPPPPPRIIFQPRVLTATVELVLLMNPNLILLGEKDCSDCFFMTHFISPCQFILFNLQ